MADNGDQLPRLIEQKRSALARATALQQQLQRKAHELDLGAAAESAETAERLAKLAAGASGVQTRCSALAAELQATRAKSHELRQRRAELMEHCTASERTSGYTPASTAENMEMVAESLVAFSEGACVLFEESFAKPVAAKIGAENARIHRLPEKWRKDLHAAVLSSRGSKTSLTTKSLREAESLLESFAAHLDEVFDCESRQRKSSARVGFDSAELSELLAHLGDLLTSASQWRRHLDQPQVRALPISQMTVDDSRTEELENEVRRLHSARRAYLTASKEFPRESRGALWSTRSV
jgi:chromosome segregation ATPase